MKIRDGQDKNADKEQDDVVADTTDEHGCVEDEYKCQKKGFFCVKRREKDNDLRKYTKGWRDETYLFRKNQTKQHRVPVQGTLGVCRMIER
jgi:hypothetical protein